MATAKRGQKEQLSMTLDMFDLTIDSDGYPVIYFDLTLRGSKNWQGGINAPEPVCCWPCHLSFSPYVAFKA